jgi:hypothetical protein
MYWFYYFSQVHVRGYETSLVIRHRSDTAVLHGETAAAELVASSLQLCAALNSLKWFSEVEKATSTLTEWAATGVPHTLLRSLMYPQIVAKFTVRPCVLLGSGVAALLPLFWRVTDHC